MVGHALVGRQDLPIPEWLFAWGASLVLIVSFVALSVAWQRTRLRAARTGARWRRGSRGCWSTRSPRSSPGSPAWLLLGVVVWSGLTGTEAPDRNFSVTFVFVTVWLGMVAISVVFGDVFRAFNPWRAIARAVGAIFELVARQSPPPPLRYPERLGRWPAVAGILAFVWLELIYGAAGFQTVGLTPHTVAIATLVYSAYTFVGMALFGSERWLDRGEAFSVYFGMFASLAPLEVRDGRLGPAEAARRRARPGSPPPGLGGAGPAHDRRDHLRRRLRGGACGADRERLRVRSSDAGPRPGGVAADHQHALPRALDRLRGRPLLGRASTACTRCAPGSRRRGWRACSPTRSSRSRSPTWSPTTSASSSSRSRPSSPSCSPTRSARARTCSAPPAAGSTTER